MIYYLDSSLLVKRFVREEGSPRVRQLVRAKHVATSAVAAVEIRSAIARLGREGALAEKESHAALDHLARVWGELTIIEARGKTLELAGDLVARHPLRAYDAIHLSSALRLARDVGTSVTFGCADRALTRAAAAEGLRVLGS